METQPNTHSVIRYQWELISFSHLPGEEEDVRFKSGLGGSIVEKAIYPCSLTALESYFDAPPKAAAYVDVTPSKG